jgi:hypothetical protein
MTCVDRAGGLLTDHIKFLGFTLNLRLIYRFTDKITFFIMSRG